MALPGELQASFLFWPLLCIIVVEVAAFELQFSSPSEVSDSSRQQQFLSRVVNEYNSYSDMEIMVITVPELTIAMNVYFDLETLQSSNCKSSSIEVYYQYGAPPLPPRQTFQNGTYIKRTSAGNLVIALDTKEPLSKPFLDALPGQWYIGVLVPQSNGVKRISELGFGNSSTLGCSFNVSMRAALKVARTASFIPSDGQTIRDSLLIGQNIRYYRYQHMKNSSKLTVTISGCYSETNEGRKLNVCPLNLSIREKALPLPGKSPALDCLTRDPCSITIPILEQEHWNYFVTTTRIPRMGDVSVYYNLSILTTGCSNPTPAKSLKTSRLDPGCVSVQKMFPLSTGKVLNQRFYPNQWNSTLSISSEEQIFFFTIPIPSDHVGSMLSVHVRYEPSSGQSGRGVLLCVQKDFAPYFYGGEYGDYYTMNCTGQQSYLTESADKASSTRMVVPFPEKGTWYISVYQRKVPQEYTTNSIQLYAEIQGCINDCNDHGTCHINIKPDLVYGMCSCDAGYTGWACDADVDVDLVSVLLLTLSNLAFIGDVVIAARLKMFPEMTVYLFLTLMSTLYHLCKSQVVCTMDESFLQLCDFYAILLSLWVTLVAMTNLRNAAYTATLNMVAVLVLFVGVRQARQSILPFILTVGIGFILVVLYHVIMWCRGKPAASFSKKRWALFILPASIFITLSFLIFALFETIDEYKYVHSLGQVFLGLGIALLLPNYRHRIGHYDLSQQLDEETTTVPNSRTPLLVNHVRHV